MKQCGNFINRRTIWIDCIVSGDRRRLGEALLSLARKQPLGVLVNDVLISASDSTNGAR
jgi:hypothetical protein